MRIAITFLFALAGLNLNAAAHSFVAKISHEVVEVGQRFQVTFSIDADANGFAQPDFSKFRVLSGPNQSRGMQVVNGQMSSSTSFSYILVATTAGTYKIGPASINVNGEKYNTQAIKLKVLGKSQASQNAQRQRQEQRKQEAKTLADYIYIKAIVDKREAYVGEKISVTYKLYSRLPLMGINLEKLPELNGFYSHEIKTVYDEIKLSEENIGGENYQVAVLQQELLYPQRSGELEIDPLAMKVTARVQTRRAKTVWDQMMGAYQQRELICESPRQKIKVLALPNNGKPSDFSGAVGVFSMDFTASKEEVESNEAIDFKLEIKGEGNLPLITGQELVFPPDFEVYDPETKNTYQINQSGAKGSKSFNYLAIPRHSGNFTIDPVAFTYFDLKSKQYKTLKSNPINISVKRGAGEAEEAYTQRGNKKKNIEVIGEDIRFIDTKPLSEQNFTKNYFGSLRYFLYLLLALAPSLFFFLFAKRYKKRKADVVGLKKSKANKLAKKRLKIAKGHLDNKETSQFYDAIASGLFGYFQDKFNLDQANLNVENILGKISDANLGAQLKGLIEQTEMARFAPMAEGSPEKIYEEAVEIIQQMEALNK